MPELTSREFDLLMTAIKSNAAAVTALSATVNELAVKLADRYLTRDEDDRVDSKSRDDMYVYIREQINTYSRDNLERVNTVRNEAAEVHNALQDQIRLTFGLLGVVVATLVAEGGWIVTHLGR